jgi:hypothetical protein
VAFVQLFNQSSYYRDKKVVSVFVRFRAPLHLFYLPASRAIVSKICLECGFAKEQIYTTALDVAG